jgi:precorrin-2 dehydrogenase/sirohydrochlorin ferrochelatase
MCDGDFLTPATLARGRRFKIAVSTGGASPALARRISERLAELFDDHVGEWVDLLEFWRGLAEMGVWDPPEARQQFLDQISDWPWLDRFRSEGPGSVERAYHQLAVDLGLNAIVV